MKKWVWMVMILIMWGVLVVIGIFRLDPDFGWHIGMGKYIERVGIPAKDPFTYTMANFDFIDHEWLTNWAMWKGYKGAGMGFLAVISASLVAAAVVISAGGGKWSWLAIILGTTLLFPRAGVRPQVIDWILLAVMLRWYANSRLWKKWRWLFPILVGVWVNVHGGFALGLVILSVIVGVRAIWEKKVDFGDVMTIGLSVMASVINPYGIRIWHEVVMQMTDSNLRWAIAEWNPFFVTLEPAFWMMGVLVGMGLWRYRKEIPGWQIVTMAGLVVAGISSLRHIALFAIGAMGLLGVVMEKMEAEASKHPGGEERMRKFGYVLGAIAGLFWIWDVGWMGIRLQEAGWNAQKTHVAYPGQAMEWLRRNPSEGEVLAPYGWGGYLIWRYPEKKVFIDGRGPSWRWESEDDRYADWAFKEYTDISGEKWEETIGKYGIRTVVWNKREEQKITPVVERILAWVGLEIDRKKAESKDLVRALVAAGWQEVYSDETAVVVRKPE